MFLYIQGYNKTQEYIVTQHPLEKTKEDFWRMVWDHNSMTIVLLSEQYCKMDEEVYNTSLHDTGIYLVRVICHPASDCSETFQRKDPARGRPGVNSQKLFELKKLG